MIAVAVVVMMVMVAVPHVLTSAVAHGAVVVLLVVGAAVGGGVALPEAEPAVEAAASAIRRLGLPAGAVKKDKKSLGQT